jgi:carboxyl-terminal processing protease
MKAMVKEAREKGAEAMVLDLSTNGGGSLEDAVKIAGLFFRTGAVVKQSAREADESERLEDRDPTVDWDGPLVVLTSRASASASEIVAGTLKDYQRAVVVGADHTFGKGSVQQVFPLAKFALVKVTVGMFFTPGGFSTQHRGVDSDIVLPGGFATDEFGEKTLDYSLPPKKLASFTSPQAFVATGPGAWDRVDAQEIRTLRDRSGQRVRANPEFQRIEGEIRKAKARGKIVRVGDSLSDSKERRADNEGRRSLGKEEQTAEYLRRADIQEAVNVALDLWGLEEKADMGVLARSHRAWDKRLADERAAAKSQRTAKAATGSPQDKESTKPAAPIGAIKQDKNNEETSRN